MHVLGWAEGWLPPLKPYPLFMLFPAWQWITLGIMTYLNTKAQAALTNFRPLLQMDDDAFNWLKSEFTTIPTSGVLLTGLFWVSVYVLLVILYQDLLQQFGIGPLSTWAIIIEGLFCFSIGGVMYFHSLRQ